MATRNIKCMGCEFEGKVEAHDTVGMVPTDKIFKVLGKHPDTAFLVFRCPSCGKDIAVDPMKTIFRRNVLLPEEGGPTLVVLVDPPKSCVNSV